MKVFKLDEALEREACRHEEGAASPRAPIPTLLPERVLQAHPGAGCDIAVLERSGSGAGGSSSSLRSVLTGGKDGYVRLWDLETGQKSWEAFLGDVWVWCLKSKGVLEGGYEGGSSSSSAEGGGYGGALGHEQCFLSGCTAGVVRLFDRRVGGCVQAVSAEDGPLDKGYTHSQGGHTLGEAKAIAGISLCVAVGSTGALASLTGASRFSLSLTLILPLNPLSLQQPCLEWLCLHWL